ncbi:6-phosphogluconolactonase [Brachybacterium hainanense]|uniref:6-phosphogluconolactonase n=1 Tax=Brachybacterium hainanense TaxID=1541174 RepID=A0ABV6RC90_9MICO
MTPTLHDLAVHHLTSPEALGRAAGAHAARLLRETLAERPRARVMLAAAPSQAQTLAALVAAEDLDFSRLDLFHMDDYLGLPPDAPQGFGNWLARHVMDPTAGAPRFHRITTQGLAPEEAARAYEQEMGEEPFDLVLLGLGVNAHLAFNDPPADFTTPRGALVVSLDMTSRRQQRDEGHFPTLDAVPERAITVSVPRLLHARHMIASVPTAAKRTAVTATVRSGLDPRVPGTALKLHPDAHLYVDGEAGADVR